MPTAWIRMERMFLRSAERMAHCVLARTTKEEKKPGRAARGGRAKTRRRGGKAPVENGASGDFRKRASHLSLFFSSFTFL